MINTSKPLREAYYAALNGNLSLGGANVPVVDGFEQANGLSKAHVIISEVSENEKESTQQTWGNETVLTLDITTFQHNGFSHDDVDDIENQVLQILLPDHKTVGVTVSGFKLLNMEKIGSDYIDEPGDNGNVSRKVLRIKQDIQQY